MILYEAYPLPKRNFARFTSEWKKTTLLRRKQCLSNSGGMKRETSFGDTLVSLYRLLS